MINILVHKIKILISSSEVSIAYFLVRKQAVPEIPLVNGELPVESFLVFVVGTTHVHPVLL